MTRTSFLVVLFAITAACDSTGPSSQSTKLEQDIVPKLTAWSEGNEQTLELHALSNLGMFESICLVPEYTCLNGPRNNSVTTSITEFHTSFGKCVPENKVAVMVVQNDVGHAALVDRSGAFRNTISYATCDKSSRAVLRRGGAPSVEIQED